METYGDIGRDLKAAREYQRLSVDEAARALHIRPKYVQALESGALEHLPGLAYARGYVQAYAQQLGMDRDDVMRRFDAVGNYARAFFKPQTSVMRTRPSRMLLVQSALAVLLISFFWRSHGPAVPTIAPPPELAPAAGEVQPQGEMHTVELDTTQP